MRRVYRLTENELIGVVKNSINEIEQERTNKVFNKIINDIDMTRGVHLRNMKKMSASKKETYLNNVMENYILDFFPRNSFIQESFDKKFTYNILFESPNRSYRKLFEFFDFFKRAVLLECGVLTERRFKNLVTELDVLGAVGDVVNKGVQMGKDVVNKGVEIGKKVVKAATPYITKFLDSEFAYLVPGLNTIKLGMDAKKVYDNWEKIKKMTFEDWVETFRNFLNGVTGIAIQIVLALTGVGNLVNLIAWGLLTVYDIGYQGFAKGNWNWYNVLTDCVGLLGSGAAAAIFKGVKSTLTTIKSIQAFVPGIARASKTTPAITKTVVPWLQKIVTGGGTIITKIGQAFTWITTKIPLIGKVMKPLQKFTKSVENFFLEIGKGMKKYFSTGALTQNMKVAKGTHFDLVSLGKKLAAVGDKNITKQIVGKVTKLYYTIAKGDNLQKILQKFAGAGLTMEILKQLNYDHGLEIKPGHKIRVA